MTTHEILTQVRELISDKERWTFEVLARAKDGVSCDPRSKEAVCWCTTGALRKVCGTGMVSLFDKEFNDATRVLQHACVERHNKSILGVNDCLGWAAILKCLDAAIVAAGPDPVLGHQSE